MRVLAADINPQIGHLLTGQTVARQHALDCFGDHALRMGPVKNLACGARFNATRMTGVPVICFVSAFFCQSAEFYPH